MFTGKHVSEFFGGRINATGDGESDSWGRAKLCVHKNAKLEQLKNCCYFIYHVNKFNKTEYLNCKPKYVHIMLKSDKVTYIKRIKKLLAAYNAITVVVCK